MTELYGHTTLVCTMEGWMSILHTLWHEGIAARGSTEIGSWLLKHVSLMFTSASHLILYSDSNGGQNHNIHLLCLYLQIAGNPLDITDHKFMVPGHSYLPSDRDFWVEWRHHPQIYTPQELDELVCHTTPFSVAEITCEDFVAVKELKRLEVNQKEDTAEDQ